MTFLSFLVFTVLAWTSSTMSNRSGTSSHFCLIPDFKENAFNISPLIIMFLYVFVNSFVPILLTIFIKNEY